MLALKNVSGLMAETGVPKGATGVSHHRRQLGRTKAVPRKSEAVMFLEL